jgi:class 3 adenylate cyclase
VTVLFADVVGSMDIAKLVGAERLREIMVELTDRCAAVVTRLGGTVGSFTGDGIMAMFGAPAALEDHAARACRAALAIQEEVQPLAVAVQGQDGIDLKLRVGLNSGEVIAGEIGSGPFGYTTIGEQVGMAQRMESVAPPGGVMLSASTARLADGAAAFGEPELVQIKGAAEPVPAQQLLCMEERHPAARHHRSGLVGRRWKLSAVEGLLDRAIGGYGTVVGVVGPPGIGKSRLVREVSAMASARSVEVFTAFCESHTSQIPFYAIARLIRPTNGVEGMDAQAARDRIRAQLSGADPEDLLLLYDLLAIADPDAVLPKVDPDARRRRLTALVKAPSLPSQIPNVYVVEDAHWIDEASESMLADLLTVIPQTRSLVMVTCRPEYRGPLTQLPGAQLVSLAPLSDVDTTSLVSQLLGPDPSVRQLGEIIAERAAGNPFFVEELARELAERGALRGERGAYLSTAETAEITVPATLQATIGRLSPPDKRTLSAAAVIGSRFSCDLLVSLGIDPCVHELVNAELIDQVQFNPRAEYAFRHPLIRAVAYEAQLKSDRAKMHRRLAAAIEAGEPESSEQNAALIAEHLEAAGDSHAAYSWHMRARAWSIVRDISAAIRSWERAVQLADALPADDASRTARRIEPRSLLCANLFRVRTGESAASAARFAELKELCDAAGDTASLAIGMFGLLADTLDQGRVGEASQLASQHLDLLESIGDRTLTVELSFVGILIKALSAEMAEVLRWSQFTIDLACADAAKRHLVVSSPLALAIGARGAARYWLGLPGWHEDLDEAFVRARTADAMSLATVLAYKYEVGGIPTGALRSDDASLREVGEAVQICEQSGDDFAVIQARQSLGVALIHHDGADSDRGVALLQEGREQILQGKFSEAELPMLSSYIAREQARRGDPDGVLPSMREAADQLFASRHHAYTLIATSMLVETLLQAGTTNHLSEAETAIDRLAAAVEERQPIRDIMVLRLRALLAKARNDDAAYRDLRERYRAMANSLGYEGHMAWADEMT